MQPFASAAISFDCPEEQYGIPQASGLYAVPCPPIVDPIQVGGTIATASAGAVQPAPGRVVRALLAEMPRHAPGEPCASAAGIERRKAAYRRDLLAYFAEIWARILLTADLYAWLEYAGQVGVSGYALRDRDVHLALLATLPANLHSDVRDMLPGLRDRSSLIAWDVLGAPLDAEERAMEDALVARDEAEERARIVARTPITKSTEDMIVLEITSDSDNRPRWLIELLDRVRPLELEGRNVILYQRPELLKRLTWGTIEHRCFRILASDSTVTGRPAELVANQGACPDIIERILSKRDGVDRRTIDPAEQKDARSSEGRKRIAQLREIVRPVAPMLLSAHALNPAYSKLVASLAVRGLLLEPDAAFFVIQAELQDCWRKTHQQTIVHPDIQVRPWGSGAWANEPPPPAPETPAPGFDEFAQMLERAAAGGAHALVSPGEGYVEPGFIDALIAPFRSKPDERIPLLQKALHGQESLSSDALTDALGAHWPKTPAAKDWNWLREECAKLGYTKRDRWIEGASRKVWTRATGAT